VQHRDYRNSIVEAGFIPARTAREMGRELRDGPPVPDEGEIDPRTGVLMCRGKDVCTLNWCSMGRYAHGRHPEPEDINYFPPGSTYTAGGFSQSDGERVTQQIQAGSEAAEMVRQRFESNTPDFDPNAA
jgi:hypothetical protein